MLDKFFDMVFKWPVIKLFAPLYKKNKEIIYYIFFGVLTTVVSWIVFGAGIYILKLNEHPANIMSWVISVEFAYLTNRKWVFESHVKTAEEYIKEMLSFYGGRLLTLLLEEVIILIFITKLGYNKMLIKILATILVLIGNYFLSKLIVFRKKEK